MKNSIFIKIFIPFSALTVALTALILLFSNKLFRENYIETEREKLEDIAKLLKPDIEKKIRVRRLLQRDIDNLLITTSVRVTIINKTGMVLADSEEDPAVMENHNNRPEIREAYAGGSGHSVRYSSTVHADMLYVALRMGPKENPLGVVRVSHYLEKINTVTGELSKALIKAAASVMLVSLLIMYIVVRQITHPLRQLNKAVSNIEKGKFDYQFSIKSNDEIAELARHFQSMSRKVNDLFRNLTKQKEELTRIIETIGDGLIVLNDEGLIVHANHKFEFMVGKNIRRNFHFTDEIKIQTLSEFLTKATAKVREYREELEIRGKSILAASGFIYPIKEYVVILHDITELKNLEQIKKDLIANVSHELRTPLTAIKGYLETLEEDLSGRPSKYLDILQRHTDRMINIVQDLLIISELENDTLPEFSEKVNLDELIRDIANILSSKAKEKNLYINIETSDGSLRIPGDAYRLEQAFINLIENAIKYTESGGITLKVLRDDKNINRVNVIIEDTGPGIPDQHIPRLFERFYVVDKSRSRKVGGTGLGLSIVKHIVQQHGGNIQVDSILGQGTKFILNFPVINDNKD